MARERHGQVDPDRIVTTGSSAGFILSFPAVRRGDRVGVPPQRTRATATSCVLGAGARALRDANPRSGFRFLHCPTSL